MAIQSLYGKLQTLHFITQHIGGQDSYGLNSKGVHDYSWLLSTLPPYLSHNGIDVAFLAKYNYTWLWEKLATSCQAPYGCKVSLFSPLVFTVKGVYVKENAEISSQGLSPLGIYFPSQLVEAQPHLSTLFVRASYSYLSINNYAILKKNTVETSMFVNYSANKVLSSDTFEYDIENGGFGTGTIIIMNTSGGGISKQSIYVKQNAYISVTIGETGDITGYSSLPGSLTFSNGVLQGYVLQTLPFTVTFDVADGSTFELELKSYYMNRSCI